MTDITKKYTVDTEFRFKQFDINQISSTKDIKIMIIGDAGTGKTYLIKRLIEFLGDRFGYYSIISPTDSTKQNYKDIIPEICIKCAYNDSIINKIILRKQIFEEENQFRSIVGKNKYDIEMSSCLIMDDCVESKNIWMQNKDFIDILDSNNDITLILSSQYPINFSQEIRNKFDYVFILSEQSINNKHKIFRDYCMMLTDQKTFDVIFSDITKDYNCIVVNNKLKTDDITKKIFYWKA